MPDGYVPLREVLYGRTGTYPYVGVNNLRALGIRVIRRKLKYARIRRDFITSDDAAYLRRRAGQLRAQERSANTLIG